MTTNSNSSSLLQDLPIAVLGAGPVGLAAAAHILDRGEQTLVFEAADSVAGAMRQWSHVRLFSPWRFVTDRAAVRLLEARGWRHPDPEELPTGGEIVERYLQPLADMPEMRELLRLGRRVIGVGRQHLGKLHSDDRRLAPFTVHTIDSAGHRETWLARAVIDATGTWRSPNPAGADGLPAVGEQGLSERIVYGIPSASRDIERYAGKRVAVIGGGHSAIQSVGELIEIQKRFPETELHWLMRTQKVDPMAPKDDVLPARSALVDSARQWIDAGRVTLHAPFQVQRIEPAEDSRGLVISDTVTSSSTATSPSMVTPSTGAIAVDRMVVNTGFRPDLSMLSELRVALDPALDAPPVLAPLIDPSVHHCGSVPPHGEAELRQPEPGFYIAGMKSYGRAPTFLMATGYEQVRSIVAHLTGDEAAARRVELELPASGACGLEVARQQLSQRVACC